MNTLVSTVAIAKDTILSNSSNMVTQSDLTNLYKDFLSNQSSNYSILITVLLGVTALLIGASFLWNFYLAKQQIKSEVKEAVSELENKLKDEMQSNLNTKIVEFEENLNRQLKSNEADVARLFAIYSSNLKQYGTALKWWENALRLYVELNEPFFIRTSVSSILEILNAPDLNKNLRGDFNKNQFSQEIEVLIPIILNEEKEEIVRILKRP